MSSDNDAPPTISYTSKRTTTKTRTAATSARRRKNIPLCHASGGDNPDGKDQHSWFARKSVGWTDEEIKNHVVSGGISNGGKSFSMVGDVILGASSSTSSKKDKKKKKRRRGKQFAWEEDDEEEDDGNGVGRMMTAADIMDEQDEVEFMAPVSVSKSYQMKSSANTNNNTQDDDTAKSANKSKSNRRQNAALDELAQVCGDNAGSSNRIQPTSANESIGWRLLRVLGYRSRLGMAFVPLAGHVGGLDSIDKNEVKELGNGKHEAKWLASKRLRAIYLPSIQNVDDSKNSTDVTKEDKKKSKVLTIPPPKVNRHGIGFDPFKNAPEFRKFHERRQELAKKQGRLTEDDTARGSNRYSTDDLKDRRQALWDKGRSDVNKDSEDEMSDPGMMSHHQSSSHYAADRDYTDFIGTKASSGFALHDEDDANVYQDGEERGDNGDGGEYTTEIHSPVASEDEDDNNGLFGKPAILEKKSKASERGTKGVEGSGKVAADAWSAWGIGESPAVKRTTMDGKPPLSGFTLAASTDSQAKSVAPKRWKGPTVPSGYVLKHHVFTKEEDCDIKESGGDGMDSGLGLDLQHRQEQQPSRASVPKLPPSRLQPPPPPDGKMLSRGGNEMNFHAVKESMKNRFTSAAETTTTTTNASESEVKDDNNNKQDMDKEEWVTVEVSTWLPTRLLCKRWGITAPSTVGMSETGKGGMVQSKEESYFRQTIMAEQPDVGSSNTKTPASGSKTTADSGMQVDNFLGDDDQEDIAPPSERPSDAVFQSIFNAESDMDISSDDDNESDEDDLDTARAEDEKESKKESAASVDRSHLSQTNGSSNADIKPRSADQYNNDLLPAADSTDSDSESSGSSKHRRKRRKSKSDERKRHRRSDSDEEDRRRRKKKKHKRSKHKKSRY